MPESGKAIGGSCCLGGHGYEGVNNISKDKRQHFQTTDSGFATK